MADSKINSLTELVAASTNDADIIYIIDLSEAEADRSKKMTVAEAKLLFKDYPDWGQIEGTLADQSDLQNELNAKVNVSDLSSSVLLYPTTAASDIGGYSKIVTDVDDVDYDDPAADVATGLITGADQLVASLASAAGILVGNPGVINVTTIGSIRKTVGTADGTFYFKIYHRNAAGTETLIGTSNTTVSVDSATYVEFFTAALMNNGTFIATDRIVLKFYGNKSGVGTDPNFDFQFGGDSPVRTLIPVPVSVIPTDHGNLSGLDGDDHPQYLLDPVTTEGDLIIGDASGDPIKLGIGTSTHVLTSNGTTASWQAATGGGGGGLTIHSTSANYTILDGDGYDVINVTTGSSADVTITLPTAADNAGRKITITKADTGTKFASLTPEGGNTVRGLSTGIFVLDRYESISLISDGVSNWIIEGDKFRKVSVKILNSGTPSISTLMGGTWATGTVDYGVGLIGVTYPATVFAGGAPQGQISPVSTYYIYTTHMFNAPTTTLARVKTSSASMNYDLPFYLTLIGKK